MFLYESKSTGMFFVYKNEVNNDDLILHGGEFDAVMIDIPYLECNCYIQRTNNTLIMD